MSSPIPIHTDRVRALLLIKRREGMSKAEFSKYWNDVHIPLLLNNKTFQEAGLLKMEALHINDEANAKFAKLGMMTGEWDGVTIMEVKSYDNLLTLFQSEAFGTGELGMAGDAANFLSPKPGHFIILPVDIAL